MAILLHVARGAGTEFVIENPADRGNRASKDLLITDDHGPLWLMPDLVTLVRTCGCLFVTFGACSAARRARTPPL
eukprot:5047469-Prymnesium_polylepis.1